MVVAGTGNTVGKHPAKTGKKRGYCNGAPRPYRKDTKKVNRVWNGTKCIICFKTKNQKRIGKYQNFTPIQKTGYGTKETQGSKKANQSKENKMNEELELSVKAFEVNI